MLLQCSRALQGCDPGVLPDIEILAMDRVCRLGMEIPKGLL